MIVIVATLCLDCVVFMAIAMSPKTPPTPFSSLEEEVTLLSHGLAINKTLAHVFISPQKGVYLFFISAVSRVNERTLLKLNGLNNFQLSPIRRMLNFMFFSAPCPISRSNIIRLAAGQQLTLTSEYQTYGNSIIGTSWGAVKIDSILYPVIAFDVSAAISYKSTIGRINVAFDKVSLNEGNAFSSKRVFVTPVQGHYFFSTSL